MQIVLFLLLILMVLIIFVSKKESLSKSMKISLVGSLLLVFFLGWLYTTYNQKVAKSNRELINAYEQGKTLTCGEHKVNAQGFVFVSGTLSFVAKKSNEKNRGVVIDISTCSR